MWATMSSLVVALVLLQGGPLALMDGVNAAPAPEKYLDRDTAMDLMLYGMLQNYLGEAPSRGVGYARAMPSKRNSEIINSLLALQKGMADVGR